MLTDSLTCSHVDSADDVFFFISLQFDNFMVIWTVRINIRFALFSCCSTWSSVTDADVASQAHEANSA